MTDSAILRYFELIERHHLCLRLLADAGRIHGKTSETSGWIVTLHFYVLCAYFKAIGKSFGIDFQDHYAIRQWMNSEEDVCYLFQHYRKVEEWSRDARYEGRMFGAEEIENRLHNWFKLVRDGVVSQLRKRGFEDAPEVESVSL